MQFKILISIRPIKEKLFIMQRAYNYTSNLYTVT